ncbi:MAG: hypothetical protein MK132_10560 [Lentisphaerales bacterium]|nr:hypothetical protein [Lentisphaerales bacterium]
MPKTSEHCKENFMEFVQLCEDEVNLRMGEVSYKVFSNSRPLLDTLNSYFSHILTSSSPVACLIYIIEYSGFRVDLPFSKLSDDSDKGSSLNEVFDLEDGRIVHDCGADMYYLHSDIHNIAIGPCEMNPTQVIDYILSQYEVYLQKHNWLALPASCVEMAGIGLALISKDYAGRSALVYKLMDLEEVRFVTESKLYLKPEEGIIEGCGLAKQPRCVAFSALNTEKLGHLISGPLFSESQGLSESEIWAMKETYDVDIEIVYGIEKIVHDTAIQVFLFLDWSIDTDSPCMVEQVQWEDISFQNEQFLSIESLFKSLPEEGDEWAPEIAFLKVSGKLDLDYVRKYLTETYSYSI